MRKLIYFILISFICIFLVSCNKKIDVTANIQKLQPYSYFPENEQRYITVDCAIQNIAGENYKCIVFTDKYMKTMYLMIIHENGKATTSSLTQIFYEDGSPMIYDNDNIDKEKVQ